MLKQQAQIQKVMFPKLIHSDKNGFEFEVFLDKRHEYSIGNINIDILDFNNSISLEEFQNEIRKRIDSKINSERDNIRKNYNYNCSYGNDYELNQVLVTQLYNYYFVQIEETFTTGKSISVLIGEEKDFRINFMLDGYFSDWQSEPKHHRNEFDALYITEISKETNELWKLEVAVSYQIDDIFNFGGKFKLFIKVGDIIDFMYYHRNAKAEIVAIDYNTVTMRFSGVVNPLELK